MRLLVQADARRIPLADSSVHCVVTSPPYWGLRDYGTGKWVGGEPGCDHRAPSSPRRDSPGGFHNSRDDRSGETQPATQATVMQYRDTCGKCGARRIDSQLGLEKTPEEYVANMVAVFREVRRVLRDDGTLWLNLGDSYSSGSRTTQVAPTLRTKGKDAASGKQEHLNGFAVRPGACGIGAKQLIGIPWRVAFALQADGWTLRSDIVWNKPNPMPESVRDRPTKAHEMLFLFSKAKWIGQAPGRFAHISDDDARWLALFLDTEGCIVVKRCRIDGRADSFAPQVSIGNTSRALMENLVRIVGHGNILERRGKNAPMNYWQLANNIAADFLRRVYPFMIVKRRQARIGIFVDELTYYRGGKKPERKKRSEEENAALLSLWARCKACNHFGAPDLSDVPEPAFGRWDSQPYFYDAEAIKEPATDTGRVNGRDGRDEEEGARPPGSNPRTLARIDYTPLGRNRRSVWTVATQPYSGAHFATFPEKLVEPCILAGTSAKGCCPECGAPWERVVAVERDGEPLPHDGDTKNAALYLDDTNRLGPGIRDKRTTTGWRPSCDHAKEPVPCRVLDPFAGSGTTVRVANRIGRKAVGIDLSATYIRDLARERVNVQMEFA